MLQGAFSSLFFSESLSHSSVSIFLFSLFCSCLSVQKRYQTKRSPSLTREKKYYFGIELFLDVEIWTDRFRNLGDGNQKPGRPERIAKVLIEVYHAVRGIPRGTV